MMEEKIYQLAFASIPMIGPVQAKVLLAHYETPEAIFKSSVKELKKLENIGEVRAKAIKEFQDFDRVKQEFEFTQKENIDIVFCTDNDYPHRLQNCFDPPILLFRKGHTDLNKSKVLSIVGTRNNTPYGNKVVKELIEYLKEQDILVISGLAIGIDAIAHQASVDAALQTVGVLGHGLKKIYPYQHRNLAAKMLDAGGCILSEYFHDVEPDKYHFPQRNRIVAGMADATLVVETAAKGGSMITAHLASDYNRDVFAVPGKTTDTKSEGCNQLIAQKKAELYFSPEEFVMAMNWNGSRKSKPVQRSMFLDLSEEEQKLSHIFLENGAIAIDDLIAMAQMSMSKVSSLLLQLELKGVVQSLPGKLYTLC